MNTLDEQLAMELLRKAVPAAVEVSLAPGHEGARPDLLIRANQREYVVELKSWGREEKWTAVDGSNRFVVWVLRRGSSDVLRKLRNEDVSFVDLAGTVRLHLPGLLIDRSDLEPPARGRWADTRNPFADRASRVPRVLFETFPRDWSIQELGERAGVSLGLVSYVVRSLSRRELVAIERSGREKRVRLSSPESLVAQWTSEYTWRKNESVAFHAPVGEASRFVRRLPRILDREDWALTLQAGASLVAAHAAWERIHVYVPARSTDELATIGVQSGWEPDEAGRVVLLKPYYRESFAWGARTLESLPVVSDLQLILDLWHYPVRGREQAETILDLRL